MVIADIEVAPGLKKSSKLVAEDSQLAATPEEKLKKGLESEADMNASDDNFRNLLMAETEQLSKKIAKKRQKVIKVDGPKRDDNGHIIEDGKFYDEKLLTSKGYKELRSIATEHGVTARSKADLIKGILKTQAEIYG